MTLQREQQRLANEMNTGNRVNAPSDDSFYAPTILNSRYALEQISQYRTNLESAYTWLKASENSIASMEQRLTRARVLAEQFSTGTYNTDEYMAASSEIQQIINDLIVLGNSQSNGSYIFGGTKNNVPPASYQLGVAEPINLNGPGHRADAQLYNDGGQYHLRLLRSISGLGSNLQIAAVNTLGSSLGLDFNRNNWSVIAAAGAASGQVIQNNTGFTSPLDLVSSQAGESFSWLSDPAAGWQTFRTWATVSGTGDLNIVDPSGATVTYTYSSAADLVSQINRSGDSRLLAVLDNLSGEARLLSTGETLNITGAGVSQDFTLQDFNNAINNGLRASGILSIDGDSPAFPPKDDESVRVGDLHMTWSAIKAEFPGAYSSAADYADGLAAYINAHTGEYTATVISSGNWSDVQIEATLPGSAGNAILASDSYACLTRGTLYGGLDPAGGEAAEAGTLHGYGYSNLNITSAVKGQVLDQRYDTVTGKLVSVTVALDWIDDQGTAQHKEVELRNGGESGRVNIAELGPDFYLYRDGHNFPVGSTFEFTLSRLQDNQEDLNVNYSQNIEMRYNWNLHQILGEGLRLDLRGMEPIASNGNTGNGMITLSGFYSSLYGSSFSFDIVGGQNLEPGKVLVRASWIDHDGVSQQREVALDSSGGGYGAFLPMFDTWAGADMNGVQPQRTGGAANPDSGRIVMLGSYSGLTSTTLTYTVTDPGQLNPDNAGNDPVKVTVDWIDDQGLRHQNELSFDCAGKEFAQEIPGSGGLSFYLDPGVYQDTAGDPDVFQQKIIISPENTADGFFFNLTPGVYQEGDSFNLEPPASQHYIIDILQQWRLALDSEDMTAAQQWSQRALEAIKEAQASMLEYAADSGSRQNRVDLRITMLDSQMVFNTETLIALQEANQTSNLLTIQNLLSVYNDTLKVTGEISGLFLLDYL
jgi:flagellin-like hook-associated protein FlgL